MSAGTLYTTSEVESKRIRAVAAFAGLSIDVKESGDVVKTPTFESKDGFKVFEAAAIGRYLASLAPNSTLLPSDAKGAAIVDQWVAFTDASISTPTSVSLKLVKGVITPYNKPIHTAFQDGVVAALTILEKALATRTYLASERVSLADLTLAAELQVAFSTIIDAAARAKLPNVVRHFETVVNQPSVKAVFGATAYAEKALQYTPPAKPAKEKKEEAPKPKAEKKPKAVEEDDDDDDKPIEEPKAKNPLDSLPKSSFNLEDWKRAYSNKDTRGAGGSLEWFYQNFDKEGFSVWRVDFKYPSELTQTFMSSNLIGGFFNRLEASRKYLFGSMGVLGANNDSLISGALIARGGDITPVVEVAPDFESYAYTRLDVDGSAEDKKFFEAALAWDLEIDGKKWVDGKNFK